VHALTATAADNAGNTTSAATSFSVTVAPQSLCTLTTRFVQSSAKYQALPAFANAATTLLVNAACSLLTTVGPKLKPADKAQFIAAYKDAAQTLVKPGWLTQSQAATLKGLASAL
jgi:hypothetical protein